MNIRRNNFDLLRLLFAGAVLLEHSAKLSTSADLHFLRTLFSAKTAVECFFVLSGFLVTMSFERSSSIYNYFGKRIRRIYPAYFSIIIICALLGSIISIYLPHAYFNLEFTKYLAANLVFANFLQPVLPGVFTHNPFPFVNGALWTIKIEFMFYLAVPLFVLLFRKYNKLIVFLIIYLASFTYFWGLKHLSSHYNNTLFELFSRQLPGQLMFFISGSIIYYYYNHFAKHPHICFFIAVIGWILGHYLGLSLLAPISLALLVIYFGCFLPFLGHFAKYGDFSYGLYIYHWPVIQLLISIGIYRYNPILGLTLTLLVTLTCAVLSWHLIEKRFLRKSTKALKKPESVLPA